MARPVVARSSPKKVAIVPAYNEQSTVEGVLDELYPLVDELVIVDDGSQDGTRAAIQGWLPGRDRATLLCFDRNRGMSAAYYTALSEVRRRYLAGGLEADDLVLTVDADGQHDLRVLDRLVDQTVDEGLDCFLARRDLSDYPWVKKVGNGVMSAWASLWAGSPLRDVESGYRVFRVGAISDALGYYRGWRYSETVEVAVILCRLGYRVRNDVRVAVPVFRSRTRASDALIDLAVIPLAAFRVWSRRGRARSATVSPGAVSSGALSSGSGPRTPASQAAGRAARAAVPVPSGHR